MGAAKLYKYLDFNGGCRNSLRGRVAMTEKHDLLQTLVFRKFVGRWDANATELLNAFKILGYGKG